MVIWQSGGDFDARFFGQLFSAASQVEMIVR
jgi:hypothetical protein